MSDPVTDEVGITIFKWGPLTAPAVAGLIGCTLAEAQASIGVLRLEGLIEPEPLRSGGLLNYRAVK